MTRFEKQIIGLAEARIAGTNCGGIHKGNWRLPCRVCIEHERALNELLCRAVHDEAIRRHLLEGHDVRDGNKPATPSGT